MLAHPALIKRPILSAGERTLIGFCADEYARVL
jgi:arsenate reductase-like glutaredoxin family protein